MKRPSILHLGKFYPPHMGGMETYLRTLVRHECSEWDVTSIVANDRPYTVSERCDGASIIRVATFGQIASMPIAPGMVQKLRGRSDDLVHLHTPNPLAAAAFLLSGHPGRLVITHHSDTSGRRFLRSLSDPFVRRAMHRAVAIITSSAPYLNSSEELRDFREKCRVVPFGRDLSEPSPMLLHEAAKIRQQYGPRVVLAAGRLVPFKGFRYLVRAMRDVDAQLILLGSGPLHAKLQEEANSAGSSERIHLLGGVTPERVQQYMHAADIFVLPSITRAESFGLVQLEAMAAGLPVINTQLSSGVPEVSLDGVSGITVQPANEIALADAINKLFNDEELRRRYSAAAKERTRIFSADAMCHSIEAIYREVLSQNGYHAKLAGASLRPQETQETEPSV